MTNHTAMPPPQGLGCDGGQDHPGDLRRSCPLLCSTRRHKPDAGIRSTDDVGGGAYRSADRHHPGQEATVARDGIDRRALDKFTRNLQREFDKRPIRIAVEADMPELPQVGGATVNNYNGPVFNGDVSGAQIAWNNDTVTQNQQHTTSTVAPGYEELAKFVTDLLRQLPQLGLDEQDLQDAEAAGNDILTEVTQPEPEKGRVRRAITALRGVLAPVATGAVAGLAAGAQDFAQTAITGLTGIV
ncbi:hypothetical protein ACFXGA_38665 [Actinosynnema sp. NPDC059335]|uniref:hypothetical protein n=1 Tax=Actinosynnema sp. NPDC059335 TaxID=3346804 RepID=UPI00366FD6DA